MPAFPLVRRPVNEWQEVQFKIYRLLVFNRCLPFLWLVTYRVACHLFLSWYVIVRKVTNPAMLTIDFFCCVICSFVGVQTCLVTGSSETWQSVTRLTVQHGIYGNVQNVSAFLLLSYILSYSVRSNYFDEIFSMKFQWKLSRLIVAVSGNPSICCLNKEIIFTRRLRKWLKAKADILYSNLSANIYM